MMPQRNKQSNPEGEKFFHTLLVFQQINGTEKIRREEAVIGKKKRDRIININKV